MSITKSIKSKLQKYGINLPTDRRTAEYKQIAKNFAVPELYTQYLRGQIKMAQIKEQSVKKENKRIERVSIKKEKQSLVRHIGSVSVQFMYIDTNKFKTGKNVIIPVDKKMNPADIEKEVKKIIDDDRENRLLKTDYKATITDIIPMEFQHNIRPVDKGKKIDNIRMRLSGAGLIDGYAEQNWDTNSGRCVFDYIIHRYGNIKGFKNICSISNKGITGIDGLQDGLSGYYNLQNCFNGDGVQRDLLEIGVNTNEIERFCETFRIPMYAIDDNEKTFRQYTPKIPNKKCPAMIFRVSNQHFYPIINKSKINSITRITSMINTIDSDMVRETFKVAENEEINEVVNVEYVSDIMEKLIETLNNKKIPEKITMMNKELYGFKYADKTFVSNENIDLIKKLCSNMKIEYSGQSIGTLLKRMIQEATGNEILPKSTHNPYVFQTLINAKKDRAKSGTIGDFVIPDDATDTDIKAVDITKCYSSCLYSPSEEWIIIDYNDTWENYDGVLKLGIYYITTDDTMLFKCNGYYSTAIIKKAITEGIAFTILKQLIPTKKENKDLFSKIIDKVLIYSQGDTSISKLVINLMSGLLGQSDKQGSKVKIGSDTEQIFSFLDKYYGLDEGIMMNRIVDTDYFIFGFNQKIKLNETNIPMYIQVLDESNIKLYDMIKHVGGELVGRKVDCAIVRGMTNTDYNEEKWGGYRMCDVPKLRRREVLTNVPFTNDDDWIDYEYEDSDEWEDIMKVVVENKGLLLQASAGNGKTYTAIQIAKTLKDSGFGVKILAPTNKAALNIGGATIHSFLKMTPDGYISPKFLKVIKDRYQYIIVDEISMITKDLWKRLCLLKQETDIVFILLGDAKQCPPVENEKIDNYFNHPAVKYICNYNRNVLNVRKRYDAELYNILKDVYVINTNKFPILETERNICYLNSTRIKINKFWNDKKKTEGDLFIAEDIFDEYTQDMYLYAGMPVIAKKTKRQGDELLFANSETFNIGNIDEKYVSVCTERPDEDGNKEMYVYDCPIEDFRQYFLMNYCSTTHKSQGETIIENYTIYDWKHMCKKIKYTALSRAKKCEQVCFGTVPYTYEKPATFVQNIQKKLRAHLDFDTKKGYKNDITTDDIQELFVKQNSECCKCGCFMKTFGYGKGDNEQFSIDRQDSKQGHLKTNIQMMCWGCNRSKKNRF
jgi:hypothetical protein